MSFFKKFFGDNAAFDPHNVGSNETVKPKPTYAGPLFAQPGEISSLFAYANYEHGEILDGLFTIIDIETSSLTPKGGYVIEVGINQIDKNGRVIKEFSSIVKPPDGQVGRTDVHGIKKSDIKNAPTFEEIAGDLLKIFRDSIVVAHNARFEERFLKAEFSRNRIKLPIMPALDTLWLSRKVINLHNYKLETVVNGYGTKIVNAHTALGDTRAVAKVLPLMLANSKQLKFPSNFGKMPDIKPTGKIKTR